VGVEFVQVDGSQGEGGGQILRTAVAFSAIQRRPVRIDRIRAGREVPGLKRQHVSALKVLAEVFGGELTGVEVGSTTVTFIPGKQRVTTFSFDMGTAASITLVLQAVVPAIALSRSRLELSLVGGTDVPWSPTYDYFERVVCEAYKSIGINFEVSAERRGYYPRGGGRVTASIGPSAGVSPLDLNIRGAVSDVRLVSRCGKLPRHVAERQLSSASEFLQKAGINVLEGEMAVEQTDSPGSSILAYHSGPGLYLGSDGIGEKGRPAENVGREVAMKFAAEAKTFACLDSNLADMVLPLLSLAPSPSKVAIPGLTSHLKSGMQLASEFTGCTWSADARGECFIVGINPKSGGASRVGHNV
jgi:RNA 3'-phosphate cyclase